MTIDGTPFSVSAAKRTADAKRRARVFRHVDAAQDADRDRQDGPEPGQNQRADDRVGHAAAGFADRLGHVREEVQVQRLNALAERRRTG